MSDPEDNGVPVGEQMQADSVKQNDELRTELAMSSDREFDMKQELDRLRAELEQAHENADLYRNALGLSENSSKTILAAIEALEKERDDIHKELDLQIEKDCLLRTERDVAQTALTKIDAIRNSIIALQNINWSEHIYPLVAALEEAGIRGAGYPGNREYFGSIIDQCKALRKERDELAAKCAAMMQLARQTDPVHDRYAFDLLLQIQEQAPPRARALLECVALVREARDVRAARDWQERADKALEEWDAK